MNTIIVDSLNCIIDIRRKIMRHDYSFTYRFLISKVNINQEVKFAKKKKNEKAIFKLGRKLLAK